MPGGAETDLSVTGRGVMGFVEIQRARLVPRRGAHVHPREAPPALRESPPSQWPKSSLCLAAVVLAK